MGYYTHFSLSVVNQSDSAHQDFVAWIEQKPETNGDQSWYDFWTGNAGVMKWYGHHADMVRLSRQFPSLVFDLYGEGEESGNIWHKYYKNGKCQKCPVKMTFDPYDESKLE